MTSITSIAQSGLQAAQLRLDSSAHNVANMNTPDFHRQVVQEQVAPGLGGVQSQLAQDPQSGVSLEQEAVGQIESTYAFKANLLVLKTADQMQGALLDEKI